MAHTVIWTAAADADLEYIAEQISRDAPERARAFVRKVIHTATRLSDFPLSGRLVPEFQHQSWREIQVYPYRVLYKVSPGKVHIYRVYHGKRLLTVDQVGQL